MITKKDYKKALETIEGYREQQLNLSAVMLSLPTVEEIEAGMKKKCLIAQDFGIYSKLIENGKTGILIKDNKDGWYKAIKKVILDPDYREELANNLHEYVKDKYELKIVTANRAIVYKNILESKNAPVLTTALENK